MLRPRDRQGSFYDTEHVCERLIPPDSFSRKFRETVWPLNEDEIFGTKPRSPGWWFKTKNKYKTGMKVKLYSCNMGSGNNSFAKKLSNLLRTPVEAPDGYININDDGSVNFIKNVNGEWVDDPNGKWITYGSKYGNNYTK